jgi:hypothetical protein
MEAQSTQARSTGFAFGDILSYTAALYRLGVLVPFIGSGMSRPACTGWVEFLQKLAGETETDFPDWDGEGGCEISASALYRVADTLVTALRPLRYEERVAKYRNALRSGDVHQQLQTPPQTKALVRLFWPLVLSTNYDDLYVSAADPDVRPEIVGRSVEDCHRVLRSLNESTPPILWALQGFLGGQIASADRVVERSTRRRELADQVVVGHQQYQRAINAEGHFRRAFAEVFRRRSLLFMGSGLLEGYLVNLFSEVMHHHGPGAYPHFALLAASERERYEPSSSFLQTRLGIVPVFYGEHADLPGHLDQLWSLAGDRVPTSTTAVAPRVLAVRPDELGFSVWSPAGRADPMQLKVNIIHSPLPLPEPSRRECSLISVGRLHRRPIEGHIADGHLKEARRAGLIQRQDKADWVALDHVPYVFQYDAAPIFAVAARSPDLQGKKHDRRDLGVIPTSVCEALKRIDNAGFEAVHMSAIAAGRGRLWHPIHPFAQAIRGVREFLMGTIGHSVRQVYVHIVDPQVWYPLLAGKIPVAELLSSDLARHRVEMIDPAGNIESLTVTLRQPASIAELLEQCSVTPEHWNVTVFPRPTDIQHEDELQADTVVTATMTVILRSKCLDDVGPTG